MSPEWLAGFAVALLALVCFRPHIREGRGAVVCAIAKDEELYIDEWIRYNLKLGFDEVHVYDNSDAFVLHDLPRAYPGRVRVVHFPGRCRQLDAYNDFLRRYGRVYKWCAFLDVDEFIVLKKHGTIKDLLRDQCQRGALSLNWYLFGSSGHRSYSPEPVTKRFRRRGKVLNHHVKSIVCLHDAAGFDNPHFPALLAWAWQRDASGHIFAGAHNHRGNADVAVIHHYFTKSKEEFLKKRARGMADMPGIRPLSQFADHDQNDVEDSSAWDFLTGEVAEFKGL